MTGVFHFMAVCLDLNLLIHAISVSHACQLGGPPTSPGQARSGKSPISARRTSPASRHENRRLLIQSDILARPRRRRAPYPGGCVIAGIYAALGPAMAVDPCAAPRIMSAPFSAIIIVAALVLPETTVGNDRSIDHPQTLDA